MLKGSALPLEQPGDPELILENLMESPALKHFARSEGIRE